MSLTPDQVARVTPPVGSDWDLAKNRDHVTTGTAGKVTAQDLIATTTGREGLWLGYSLIAGAPVDHGEVASEAAMLALHNWAADPLTTTLYHYVQFGDSCTRTDDPGYRWHCISGHGISLPQWERRPLGDLVAEFDDKFGSVQLQIDALEIELGDKIGSASLDGYATEEYVNTHLPVAATASMLGTVRVGNGLAITAEGVLSVTATAFAILLLPWLSVDDLETYDVGLATISAGISWHAGGTEVVAIPSAIDDLESYSVGTSVAINGGTGWASAGVEI